MIRQTKKRKPQSFCTVDHLFQRVGSITEIGMNMKKTLNVAGCHKLRQGPFHGRFYFPHVLAKFGSDVAEAQGIINRGLRRERKDPVSRIVETVLIEFPPMSFGETSQPDIVFLASCEIEESRGKLVISDNPQIGLYA